MYYDAELTSLPEAVVGLGWGIPFRLMRLIKLLLLIATTFTGCVYHHRVTYSTPLQNVTSINTLDSIYLPISIFMDRKEHWFWLPPATFFDWDGNKFKIGLSYYGENYEAYNKKLHLQSLEIMEDSNLIFKSSKINLFEQDTFYSYYYKTDYFMKMAKPFKRNLTIRLKFNFVKSNGSIDSFRINAPLNRDIDKGFSWFMDSA